MNTKFIEKYFQIKERHSTIKQEIIGGITTFLAMSYIIIVNPSILGMTGMDKGALITVTCLTAALATLIAGLWANAPFALAPSMGLNAFFTFTLVLGEGLPWQTALGIVFLSGCFFFILSLGGIREKIANAIPLELKIAVAGGIGLFITFIGLKTMGLIVGNKATIVSLGEINRTAFIGIVGLIIAVFLEIKRVKGGILIGIIIATVLGFIFGDLELPDKILSLPPSITPIAGKLDIKGALKLSLIGPIFSFMFVDLFDTLGTLISCSREAGIVDKNGQMKGFGRMLYTDVFSTICGAIMGTSTVTTFVESAAGIAAGAKTGLASVITGSLFLLALLFSPLVVIVPGYATAPALIMVGVYMFRNVRELDFKNLKTLFPCFIIIVMMPLTYSVSIGLSLGFLAYIILHLITFEFDKVSPTLIFIGILCLVDLIV